MLHCKLTLEGVIQINFRLKQMSERKVQMKNIKTLIVAILVAASTITISPAYADHGRGGHWSGGCFGCGLWIFDALLATDIAIQASQQPVVISPSPVYVQPAPQQVYIQPQLAPAPAQPQVPVWYFCKSTNGYYPYTQYCPEGWQPVSAIPTH